MVPGSVRTGRIFSFWAVEAQASMIHVLQRCVSAVSNIAHSGCWGETVDAAHLRFYTFDFFSFPALAQDVTFRCGYPFGDQSLGIYATNPGPNPRTCQAVAKRTGSRPIRISPLNQKQSLDARATSLLEVRTS